MDNKKVSLPNPKYIETIKSIKKPNESASKKVKNTEKYLDLLFNDTFLDAYFLTISIKNPK
tara:strand:+ start:308 stop:490 length:183 start_codon:yes stop_codon:yes gene_type:complete